MLKRGRTAFFILSLIIGLIIQAVPASAGAIRSFAGFQGQTLNAGDDVSSSATPLGFTINFQGQTKSTVYVNTNGNLTFDGAYSGYPGMPSDNQSGAVIPDLNGTTRSIIAGFFADIDTTSPNLGTITYGTTTLNGHAAFVANFSNMEYYRWYTIGASSKHNSFQIILIDRSDTGAGNFDIEYNYDQVEWESGDSSGGTNGAGGASAQVGYSNGTGAVGSFFQLPGSGVPGSFINGGLVNGSKDSGGVAGRYIFAIRTGSAPTGPAISTLSPSTATAGGATFTLTVNGSGFTSGSTVLWNGTALTTTFVNATQLTASVAASRIASAGAATVTVNAGGTASNGAVFTVTSSAPTLSISSLSPSTAQAGGAAFTLTVNGSGFTSTSTVLWNGASLPTTFVGSTKLTATVSASLIAVQVGVTVTVNAGGTVSGGATFTITAPPAGAVVSGLSPSSAQAGGAAFTLSVNGSGFVANSTVLWNGASLPTTVVGSTQLTAFVAANRIATQGVATVAVSTGAATSNGLNFTITAAPSAPSCSGCGIVGYWKLDETSGTTAADSSGNNNTGAVTAPTWTAGKINNGLSFNGSATEILVPNSSTLNPTSEMTVTAWIKADDWLGGNRRIVQKGDDSNLQYRFLVEYGQLKFDGQCAGCGASTTTLPSLGVWHFIAGTINSTSAVLYIDGVAVATGPGGALNATAGDLNIGTKNPHGVPTDHFVGIIDELSIYNRALTAQEIAAAATPAPPAPAISSLSPSTAQAGSGAFVVIVNGSGFAASSTVLWNGAPLTTIYISATQLMASVEAGLIGSQGTATVTVSTAGTASNGATFTIGAGVPLTISNLNPTTAPAGGATFTLTVNGTGFGASNSTVLWNGTPMPTSFVSANQLTAVISGNLIPTQGIATVSVTTGGTASNSVLFTIGAAAPGPVAISGLSPSTAAAGGSLFILTVNGSGFAANSQILWNGAGLATTFVSANQLTATIAAGLIATQGTATVTVNVNGTVSNGSTFTITAPAPVTISSLSPSSAQAGGATFMLTVNGSGFASNSTVLWNGTTLATTFVGATQVKASVGATLIGSQGTASVTVSTGAAVSSGSVFTITAGAPPVISSLSPSSMQAGGPTFTLTVNGSGFGVSNSTVLWNGTPMATSFVSANQLTAVIAGSQIATQGTATVTVSTGAAVSNGSTFTITAPAPGPTSISSLSPSSATAGSPTFTLTVNGAGFGALNSTVLWNGTPTSTSFVSANQLTATIPGNLIASQGTATVTVNVNGVVTNGLVFTITAPGPVAISSLSPTAAQAGGAAFTLTVNGSGFASNSTVLWNGISMPTTFVSANQLTATIVDSLIASQGTATVTVSTGAAVSSGSIFTITAGVPPAISSLSPSTATAGGATFTLTVNGSGFTASSTVLWNGAAAPTGFVSASRLTAVISGSQIASQGTATVTVNAGGTVSNGSAFTITSAAGPLTISSLSPSSAQAGGVSFTLTVNGAGFTSNSTVLWNGTPMPTAFSSASQLTATIGDSLIAGQGTATVTVNAGGTTSNGSVFTITAGAPLAISSLSPSSASAGGNSFTLTVNGSGFAANASVLWNGTPAPTSFVSASQLTAVISGSQIASQGTATVTVSAGGTASSGVSFSITAGTPPAITSLSPSTATAGGATFTLTVNGSGFTASSTVLWNGTPIPTTFVSANRVTAVIAGSQIANQGTATVTVNAGGTASNGAAFTIVSAAPSPLTISGLSPSAMQAGGGAFTLTVNGSSFASNSMVLWNGSALTTAFVSATQLTAPIAAGLIATQGTATVTVSTGGAASNSALFTITPAPPPPPAQSTISGISPSSAQAGGAAFTLAVNGSGFTVDSGISWNGTALATTFVSATQLTGSVGAGLIANQGSASVTVSTAGNASNGATFTITAASGPAISGISPSSAQAGSGAFILTVNGSGFTAESSVLWNGSAVLTTFVSATQLNASVAANLIASQGTASVTVSAGGASTNNSVFTITAPPATPAITSLSPPTAQAGSGALTLTVSGSNFTNASTVLWNGGSLPTTFVNANQLTASVASSYLASQGTVSISVSSSNSLPFTVVGGVGQQMSIFPTVLTFNGLADGPALDPANVSVWTNGAPVTFHVAASSPWLHANVNAGQTNQGISVTANTASLSPGGYTGEVLIQNDAAPSDVRTIPVTLTVAQSVAAQLEVAPLNQAVEIAKGSQAATYDLIVTNPTSGKLSFVAQTRGGDWITLRNTYGSATPSTPSSLSYTLDPTGLAAGIYNGQIIVTDINSTQSLTAQITMIVSDRRLAVAVSQTAMEFTLVPQQAPATKTFGIRNEGPDPVVVSLATVMNSGSGNWLSTSPQLSLAPLASGDIVKISVQVDPQGLAPGRHFGSVQVNSGSAGNAQIIPVVLNIQDNSSGFPRLSPAGITLTGTAGMTAAATTHIQLSNPTANPVAFSSVPGAAWLALQPSNGSIAPFHTLDVTVTANFATVAQGVRSDVIRIPFSDGIVSTLNVLSIASSNSTQGTSSGSDSQASLILSCVPSRLAVQLTSLEQGFTLKTGGVAAIKVKVLDNCGMSRPNSAVIAHIDSEPNPLVLAPEGDNIWSTAWSPTNARANVRVVVAAASDQGSGILTGQSAVTGAVNAAPPAAAPIPNRVESATGSENGGQFAPGSWVSIFGDGLADTQVIASEQPYPTQLGGTSVTLGGTRLPLLFVDPKQLNAFIPFQVTPNTRQQLIIERQGALSMPFSVTIADAIPGIYTLDQSGTGQGTIMVSGTAALAAPTPKGSPAPPGASLEIYCTGLGLVSNSPQDGQTAALDALSPTVNPVQVMIGGVRATSQFAGLTPGFVGLYKVSVQMPEGVPSGDSVPVSVSVAGKESNTVTIAVQ